MPSNISCVEKGDAICNASDTGLNNNAEFGIYTDLYAMEDILEKKYTDLVKNIVFPTAYKKGRVLARKGALLMREIHPKGHFVRTDFSNVS